MKMDKKSKNQKIHEAIIHFMRELNKWDDNMEKELPQSYENYGGHLLFSEPAFSNRNWNDAGEDLWKLVCKLYDGEIIAIKGRIQNDGYRSPQVRLLYGDTTLVNFVDNGIKYCWDITKTMFSSGNVTERHRIAKLNCNGEIIVDLFAGIGYFTLPYLIHAKAKFVHACEWNKNAVEALRKNLEINGVADKCEIYEGDNRKVAPRNVANRVNAGLIPSSEDYWQVACEALVKSGGIIYIHQNITSKFSRQTSCTICDQAISLFKLDLLEKSHNSLECLVKNNEFSWNQLRKYQLKCKQFEWYQFAIHLTHSIAIILESLHPDMLQVCVKEVIKVKSYAPHIDHIVYTVHCYSRQEETSL